MTNCQHCLSVDMTLTLILLLDCEYTVVVSVDCGTLTQYTVVL